MDERIRTAVGDGPAWVVGGALRDELLGRELVDVDVACADPELAARLYSRLSGGAVFPLSERHGAWRVVQESRTVDVTRTRGTVEEDLGLRDFTINAMALPLAGGDLVDPHGGRADLDAGLVRAVSDRIYDDDPLRLLRVARIARQLGLSMNTVKSHIRTAYRAMGVTSRTQAVLWAVEHGVTAPWVAVRDEVAS